MMGLQKLLNLRENTLREIVGLGWHKCEFSTLQLVGTVNVDNGWWSGSSVKATGLEAMSLFNVDGIWVCGSFGGLMFECSESSSFCRAVDCRLWFSERVEFVFNGGAIEFVFVSLALSVGVRLQFECEEDVNGYSMN